MSSQLAEKTTEMAGPGIRYPRILYIENNVLLSLYPAYKVYLKGLEVHNQELGTGHALHTQNYGFTP